MIQTKSRLFAFILLGSLALNFFLGGLLVGKHFGPFSESRPFHPPPMGPKLHWLIQSLPAESQAKVRPLLQTHRQHIRPQMRQMRQARRAVHQQLTASDFNAQALAEALTALRQTMMRAREKMHSLLVEIASQLDEKERQQLSEAMPKRPHRHKGHFRGPPPD
jgi:uncharacterized membrane protein